MPRRSHRYAGRPKGPPPDRGHRPYDPRGATRKRMKILAAVYKYRREIAQGEIRLCDLAAALGTSISYLSITKNSIWGQQILRSWAIADGEDPDQFTEI